MTDIKNLEYFRQANSIHYYLESTSAHVFVYNNSDKDPSNNKKKTVIIIPMNERKAIQIPATTLPIDLTEQAPKEDLVKNSFFMDVLKSKLVTICPDEEAFKILSTPEAQFERDKLSISTRESLDELYKREKIEVLDSSVEAPKVEGLDVDLTVLEAMNREDIQPAERFSIIKNIEASLEQKDWEYIYEHSSDDLKAFAASKLA